MLGGMFIYLCPFSTSLRWFCLFVRIHYMCVSIIVFNTIVSIVVLCEIGMQANLCLVKQLWIPRVDIVVASIREVGLSLSGNRSHVENILVLWILLPAQIEILGGNKGGREKESLRKHPDGFWADPGLKQTLVLVSWLAPSSHWTWQQADQDKGVRP